MSKTVDELMEAFRTGFRQRMQGPGIRPEGDIAIRAGITAVIRALRDEFITVFRREYLDDASIETFLSAQVVGMLDEILGSDAGSEKVADTVAQAVEPLEVREVTGASPVRTATDPAPAVCEWTDVGKGWDTGCGGWDTAWSSANGKIICSICKAAIKFTEAQR